ncbi:5-hydroxytryptamine receptor 1A-alpha-like [Diadema antillarum]|uniref:5-hydroxytryptamine receptor 1A-alpha-like n=1 Tax=Diadema antillarum TaxID=105358 RepID=UPI003A8595A2
MSLLLVFCVDLSGQFPQLIRKRMLNVLSHLSGLSVIILCALSFNLMTIVVILRTRSLRQNPHNLLMLNLAVADLGVVLASMTFSMASIFDEGRFLFSHRTVCQANGFLSTWFSFTNLPLIFSIAFDRFLIIVCPPRHAPPKRLRIGLLIAMSWTMGFMVALTAATCWLSEFRYNVHTKHCSPVWSHEAFGVANIVLRYAIVVPALVVFYAVITFYLWREGRRLKTYEISKPSLALTSRSPSDRIGTLEESPSDRIGTLEESPSDRIGTLEENRSSSQTETAASASKDYLSVDSVEIDHHGNKEDDGSVPSVSANRKSAWRTRRRRHLQAHSRVARVGAVLVFMSIICWTPYLLIHANYIRVSDDHWFGVFTMWLAYCNTVLDPLVYSCMNRRVRADLWKLARRVRCCGFRRSVTFNVPK